MHRRFYDISLHPVQPHLTGPVNSWSPLNLHSSVHQIDTSIYMESMEVSWILPQKHLIVLPVIIKHILPFAKGSSKIISRKPHAASMYGQKSILFYCQCQQWLLVWTQVPAVFWALGAKIQNFPMPGCFILILTVKLSDDVLMPCPMACSLKIQCFKSFSPSIPFLHHTKTVSLVLADHWR